MLLLQYATYAIADLIKAEKFLLVKHDPLYSYQWLTKAINSIAAIDVLLQGGIPHRDIILQAVKLNPALFTPLYTELGQRTKTPELMEQALTQLKRYLEEHTPVLFRPILSILSEEGTTMGLSLIHERIALTLKLEPALLVESCEWLAEHNIIEKLSSPVELTTKSRSFVEEVAYYYDGRCLGDQTH